VFDNFFVLIFLNFCLTFLETLRDISKEHQFLDFRKYQGHETGWSNCSHGPEPQGSCQDRFLTQFAFNWTLCSPDLTPTEFFLSAYVRKSCEAENGDH
jgi:hypothetical protein